MFFPFPLQHIFIHPSQKLEKLWNFIRGSPGILYHVHLYLLCAMYGTQPTMAHIYGIWLQYWLHKCLYNSTWVASV